MLHFVVGVNNLKKFFLMKEIFSILQFSGTIWNNSEQNQLFFLSSTFLMCENYVCYPKKAIINFYILKKKCELVVFKTNQKITYIRDVCVHTYLIM
jgi:hypothetical protein